MNKIKEVNTGVQGAFIQNVLPEKILINENLVYFGGVEQDAIKLIKKANHLAEKYEELNLGRISQQTFDHLILVGVSLAKEEYLKNALAETSSISLKNLLRKDVDNVFKELQLAIDDVTKYHPGSKFTHHNLIASETSGLQFATFKDHRFHLTDHDVETIKDHYFRTYISTQDQLDAVENLKVLISCFNQLNKDIKKFNPAISRLFSDTFNNVGRYAMIENGVATLHTENIIEIIGN